MLNGSFAVTAARRVSGDQEQERTASAIASHRFLAAKSALTKMSSLHSSTQPP